MARRRLLGTLAGLAVALTVATGGAHGVEAGPAAAGPTGPLAAPMAEALEQQPGGVQVSDNAMAWDDGAVLVVWPSPGDEAAPAGLGDGVREDVVAQLGLAHQAWSAPDARTGEVEPLGSASTCPPGYYCFYTGTNFDGARYQFSSTCSAYASSYGFDNTTSSWVNRNFTRAYRAYDYVGGTHLWTMGPGANNPYVGASDDNRMSYWSCYSA